MSKNIYVLLSKTPTKFGQTIRKIAKQEYNHASIILDDNLTQIYAFARSRHNAPLLGGLVRESLDRFTLRRNGPVPIILFQIPVSDEQHEQISQWISEMLNNKKYVYNLFSVLTYPIFKGFSVKHAFSCIEFVTYILQYLGYCKDRKACKYKPDDLLTELSGYKYIEADIRTCISYNEKNSTYFEPFKIRIVPKSIIAIGRIIRHGFLPFPSTSNLNMFNIK